MPTDPAVDPADDVVVDAGVDVEPAEPEKGGDDCMGFEDEFYSMGEVAKVLKTSRATVLRRIRDGTLPPLVDGLRRFRGEDLRATVGCRRTWLSVLAERERPRS